MLENNDGDNDDDNDGGEGRPGDAGVQFSPNLIPPDLLLLIVSDHMEGPGGDEAVHMESSVTDPVWMSQCQYLHVSWYMFNFIVSALNWQLQED